MIGDNIRSRRLELGMTQDELAQKLGYTSRSTIAKIEKNTNDIPLSKVEEFAKVLNTTASQLMGWESEDEIINEAGQAILAHIERNEVLNAYMRADDVTKEMVRRILGL